MNDAPSTAESAPADNPQTTPPAPTARPVMLLVDGSSYLYRAYHAMPDLRADPADRASQPTGAISA